MNGSMVWINTVAFTGIPQAGMSGELQIGERLVPFTILRVDAANEFVGVVDTLESGELKHRRYITPLLGKKAEA